MTTGLFELISLDGKTSIKKYFFRLDALATWLQDHPHWTWRLHGCL